MDLALTIISIIFVFIASYYVTKLIASSGIGRGRSRCMEILDKIVLTRSLCVYLIKIGNCALAVSVTEKGTSVLAKYDNYELATVENMEQITNNGEMKGRLEDFNAETDVPQLGVQCDNASSFRDLLSRELKLNNSAVVRREALKVFESFVSSFKLLIDRLVDFLGVPDETFMMDRKIIERSIEHEKKIDEILEKVKNRLQHREENIRRVV